MHTALQFGGGKDSLACLYLLKPRWDEILVTWLNTGAAFPETQAQMEEIRALVPHFHEVRTDVWANIEHHGWPTDVLPVRNAFWGKATTGEAGIMMQSWFNCCHANFWTPLDQAMRALGIKTIIRGQRLSEDYKSPIRHGMTANGITYEFPLQDWSEQRVSDYLHEQGVEIPAHYEMTSKSLDCWNCTAYLDAKLDQLKYLEQMHPQKHTIVIDKLRRIRTAVHRGMEPLEAACK